MGKKLAEAQFLEHMRLVGVIYYDNQEISEMSVPEDRMLYPLPSTGQSLFALLFHDIFGSIPHFQGQPGQPAQLGQREPVHVSKWFGEYPLVI